MERPYLAKLKEAAEDGLPMADLDEIRKAAEENVHVDPFQKMVALAIIEAIDANTQALIGIAAPAIVESIDAQASTFLEAASLA